MRLCDYKTTTYNHIDLAVKTRFFTSWNKNQTCLPLSELRAPLLKQLNALVAGPAARTRYDLTEQACPLQRFYHKK